MANLKEKILQSLKNIKQIEPILNTLSKSQENLLKNHSNPVFNPKDKNKILTGYTDLQDIGKSLYRYNTLQEHDYLSDAQEEKENIEQKVLKTGISYNKYVWHSKNDEHTCEECRKLDGQEFDFYDEVPERPHTNCKCYVEIVESEVETGTEKPQNKKDNSDIATSQPTLQKQETTPQHKNKQSQKWILPVPKGHHITSQYGYRMHPVYHEMKLHDGIDINASANTPVYAVADGTIKISEWVNGYGNYIEIEHTNNLSSFYAHLNKSYVVKDSKVKQGENIGLSGNTGIGTGPHLHFGVKSNKQTDNPTKYLPSF